jgi:predicted nucleic acid-binding protein
VPTRSRRVVSAILHVDNRCFSKAVDAHHDNLVVTDRNDVIAGRFSSSDAIANVGLAIILIVAKPQSYSVSLPFNFDSPMSSPPNPTSEAKQSDATNAQDTATGQPPTSGTSPRSQRPDKHERAKHYDPFILEATFPDSAAIFTFKPKPVTEVVEKGLIFLDTNVLLAPYQASQEQLNELGSVYEKLVGEKRLVIPARVAREFARHRLGKLKELVDSWDAARNANLQVAGVKANPILGVLPEYEQVKAIEQQLREKVGEYRKAMDAVRGRIANWYMDDPVSELYRTVLPSAITECATSTDKLKESSRLRWVHEIPPGYRDGEKPDEGIGDVVIWHTILEQCRERNSDAVFVTNETKPDWTYVSATDQQLFARYELIEEFRRVAGGTFVLLSFSRFLETVKASKELVEVMQSAEAQQPLAQMTGIEVETNRPSSDVRDDRLWLIDNILMSTAQFRSSADLEVLRQTLLDGLNGEMDPLRLRRLNQRFRVTLRRNDPSEWVSLVHTLHTDELRWLFEAIKLVNRRRYAEEPGTGTG